MVDHDSSHAARAAIIVLDPFTDEAEMYAHALRMAGFEPAVCDDAEAALATALKGHVAAVITRILQRGQVDGIEFTRRLKGDARTRRLPVLIISTQTHPRFRKAAEAAGCDAFLLLPCTPDLIVSELQRLIDHSGTRIDT